MGKQLTLADLFVQLDHLPGGMLKRRVANVSAEPLLSKRGEFPYLGLGYVSDLDMFPSAIPHINVEWPRFMGLGKSSHTSLTALCHEAMLQSDVDRNQVRLNVLEEMLKFESVAFFEPRPDQTLMRMKHTDRQPERILFYTGRANYEDFSLRRGEFKPFNVGTIGHIDHGLSRYKNPFHPEYIQWCRGSVFVAGKPIYEIYKSDFDYWYPRNSWEALKGSHGTNQPRVPDNCRVQLDFPTDGLLAERLRTDAKLFNRKRNK